ncbi:No_hits_found [Calothrix sp. PCC 7716]|nr:No_hits_found [Calothrix sp. PCC 7716]
MLKLPFKTTPREFEKVTVGNPEIGELEFPKYGDLSPNERAHLKFLLKDVPDLRASAVKLARKVSNKSGIALTEVYNALVSADTEVLGEHLEEFVEFQALMEDNAKQRELALVTTLIRYRLNSKPEEEVNSCDLAINCLQSLLAKYYSSIDAARLINTLRKEIDSKLELWSINDTGNPELLPPQLLTEIAEFARNEENGWQETPAEQQEVTEEELGKSSEENLKNQTGEKSTGALNATGQTSEDSATATSETSQPG